MFIRAVSWEIMRIFNFAAACHMMCICDCRSRIISSTLEWGDVAIVKGSGVNCNQFRNGPFDWDRQAIESAGNAWWINQFTDRSANWVLHTEMNLFADHDIITRASRFFNLIQLVRTIHVVHILDRHLDWLEILKIARKSRENVYIREISHAVCG